MDVIVRLQLTTNELGCYKVLPSSRTIIEGGLNVIVPVSRLWKQTYENQ